MVMKTEEKANSKQIVEMLRKSRIAQHVNLAQLAEGVCTRSMLQKVEYGERTVNRNSLNRLLARLGVDQKKYEKYLYYTEYDEWKLKNDIINAVEENRLQLAKELLADYEKAYAHIGDIELQFLKFMKAQVLQHMNPQAYSDEIYRLYREAMLLTVPNVYEKETITLMLSTDELNLVLECRNREMYTTDVYEIFDIYRGFIKYIDNTRFDIGARAKIYPKVVVYMYNNVKKCIATINRQAQYTMYRRIMEYCQIAIDILREDCKSYYMCELFKAYMDILVYLIDTTSDRQEREQYQASLEQVKRWNDTYIDVCTQYDVPYLMIDCCYLYREEDVYCINDVIRKRRKMLGITMTKLSDGICSTRTIRRLERRECKALEGIVDELFGRLGMSNEYANMGIVTDKKEDIELYEQCRRYLNSKDYERAEALCAKLEKRLPDTIVNKQILLQTRSLIEWNQRRIGIEQHICDLKKAVAYTLPSSRTKTNEVFLSYPEIAGIHAVGIALKQVGRNEKAVIYIEELVKYFKLVEGEKNAENVIGLYEMVMSLYANILGSMSMFEESNLIFSKLNKIMLKLRRTNIIHFNIYNIAWNKNECYNLENEFKEQIKICVNLCQLTKNNYYESSYLSKLNN